MCVCVFPVANFSSIEAFRAFSVKLCRSVNERTFYGVAKEKERAAQEFEERISAGENAGLVESRYVHGSYNRTPASTFKFLGNIHTLGTS